MSRIAEIKTHPVSIALEQTLWTAHEELRDSGVILVEVVTDDGITGIGQIHGAPQKAICEWVARLAEVIRGMEATATVAVWEKLFSLTSPRPGGMGGRDGLPPPLPRSARPGVMAAIAGIDIALWDIRGKSAGVPVYRLLGAEKRPIFTYATGGYYQLGAPDRIYAEELAGFVEAGFRAVKLKTGGGAVAEEARRVRAVREAIGRDTLLMLDMIAPHAVPELHAHLVMAFPRCGFGVESHGNARRDPLAHGLYRERPLTRDSHVHLSDRPGFGVEVDWEFVRRHRA